MGVEFKLAPSLGVSALIVCFKCRYTFTLDLVANTSNTGPKLNAIDPC
jgi:hypothetical protein